MQNKLSLTIRTLKSRINFKKLAPYTPVAVIVFGFAIIGLILTISSQAATYSAPKEAEVGTLAGASATTADAKASSGNYVKFGGSATPPPTTPPPTTPPPTTPPPTTPPPAALVPTGVAGNWALTFNDEFDGTAIDKTKWTTETSSGNNSDETACFDPSTLSVAGGYLNMQLLAKSCQGKQNMGGQMYTAFKQAYGFFEARMNLPGDGSRTYNFPAFWIVPYGGGAPCWPTGGELDIMETIGGGAKTSYGYGGSCDNVTNGWSQFDGGGGYWGGWHTFAADWQPGSMTVYYDGKKVGTHNDSGVKGAMNIILDNTSRPMGGATKTGTQVQVDYVRAWKKQ
jgi:hypothetical protein